MSKRVVIVERNYIVGAHIQDYLDKSGASVYPDILKIEELFGLYKAFNPDIIVINKKLFYENIEQIKNSFEALPDTLFVVLYVLNPGNAPEFSYNKINYLEKPFASFEFAELLTQ